MFNIPIPILRRGMEQKVKTENETNGNKRIRKKNTLPKEEETQLEKEDSSEDNEEIKNKEVAESSTQETADK